MRLPELIMNPDRGTTMHTVYHQPQRVKILTSSPKNTEKRAQFLFSFLQAQTILQTFQFPPSILSKNTPGKVSA